jgi:hypothetical protein
VAIDLSACIATGQTFHGHAVKAGPVFYIAGEGRNALKRRFDAWSAMQGVPLDSATLFTSDGQAAQFLDENSANMVARSINDLASTHGAPRLIVVDTLARNLGPGDENNQRDASRFIAVLDSLKALWPRCALLVVHHSGHAEKERARGSSVLKAALDCEFKVEKEGDEITLTNTKMKDGATPKPMVFKLVSIEQSAALEFVGEFGGHKQPLTQQQQQVFDAFKAINKDGATLEAWRARAMSVLDGTLDAKRKAFKRASDAIIARNYVIMDGEFYKFPPMPGMNKPEIT